MESISKKLVFIPDLILFPVSLSTSMEKDLSKRLKTREGELWNPKNFEVRRTRIEAVESFSWKVHLKLNSLDTKVSESSSNFDLFYTRSGCGLKGRSETPEIKALICTVYNKLYKPFLMFKVWVVSSGYTACFDRTCFRDLHCTLRRTTAKEQAPELGVWLWAFIMLEPIICGMYQFDSIKFAGEFSSWVSLAKMYQLDTIPTNRTISESVAFIRLVGG